MKNICIQLNKGACIIAGIIFSAFFAVNTVAAFLTSSVCNNMEEQKMLTSFDNPLISITGTLIMGALCYGSYLLYKKWGDSYNKVLLIFVLMEYVVLGLFLVVCGRTIPAADSGSVFYMGETLSRGSLSMVSPDSYLSYYPQQIGLMTFFGIIIRLIHLLPVTVAEFHFVKVLYVFITAGIVLVMYLCIGELFDGKAVKSIYLTLMAGCFYLIMYSNFLYGEIPALLGIGLCLLGTLRLYRDKSKTILNMAMVILGLTFSVFVRKNSMIFTIAFVITVMIASLTKLNKKLVMATIFAVIVSLSILPVTTYIYEQASGSNLSKGVTVSSYVAMGMQEGGRACGWYNGFNFNTFTECNMDADAANVLAGEAIRERINAFKGDSSMAVSFYMDKYLSQWTDGTYASAQATLAEYGGRIPVVESLYTGGLYRVFAAFSNCYQNLIYAGSLICMFGFIRMVRGKKKYEIITLLPVICIFGGFLFHMLWEANSRYIFTYGVLNIFYGAAGLEMLFNRVSQTGKKNGKKPE